MPKKSLIVFVMVSLAFFASNLTFRSGLDDTVEQITAERIVGEKSASDFVTSIPSTILKPGPADSLRLYRPLRLAGSCSLVLAAQKIRWLPDLFSSLAAGICALVLLRYHTICKLPAPIALFAALWFFSCIPVVAMGQVVLVCQFLVIGGLYLVPLLFQRYLDTRNTMWLLGAAGVVFVFGLYGEAMLIAPLAVGVQGIILLLRREFGSAVRAFAFAGLGCFLVLGNAFLLTGDPGQFTRGMRSVLVTRGYDVSAMGQESYLHILIGRLRGYSHSFRSCIFTGIFFSVSPLLFFMGMAAVAAMAIVKRRFVTLAMLAAAAVVVTRDAAWGIGAASAVLCFAYAGSYPLLVSIVVAGTFVLGPIFIIDTHITYLLPALIGLLFVALLEAGVWLQAHGQRVLVWCPAAMLALVAATNFGSGVYFCSRIANDNRELAAHLGEAIRSGSVLVNFRHAIDLYLYANEGRKLSAYEGNLHFTATVPLWSEDRAVRDEKKLQDWFESAAAAGKPKYFLIVAHDRLAQKFCFHGPRFLDSTHYRYSLKYVHVFKATIPFFDPGFLLVNHFYKKSLAAGFIGYPIFPDMIDDVGLEYGLFTKRLFACYRLLEVTPCDERGETAATPERAVEERVVLPNYLGYRVVAEGPRIVAYSSEVSGKDSHETIVSERLDVVLQKIQALSQRTWLPTGADSSSRPMRLIEEGVNGFNIIAYGNRFFGLAQDEGAFEIHKVERAEYRRCVEGTSIQEVKQRIKKQLSYFPTSPGRAGTILTGREK